MAEYDYFQCILRITFNMSGLSSSYQALNPLGFSDDIKILKIINTSTAAIDISYNGVNDHDYYIGTAANTNPIPLILNFQTNHACNSSYGSGIKYGRKGQVIWGKGTGAAGNLYIIGYR